MPRKRSVKPPAYRLHRQSGQAIVTLTDLVGARRDILLGPHGSQESRLEYNRVVLQWEATGRRTTTPTAGPRPDLTVNELALAYWRFAEGYYVKNGEPTKQLDRIKRSIRPTTELYGHTPASAFGPLALKTVREQMVKRPCGHCKGTGTQKPKRVGKKREAAEGAPPPRPCRGCNGTGVKGWTRGLINSSVGCIKRMFKWAVAEELIDSSVFEALRTVDGLLKGRSKARETRKIRPVDPAHVDAILPLVTPPVRGMLEVQRLTGMRPGEVVLMRPCDIDRTGDVWEYRPESHKTEHHDRERVAYLGPRAQAVLLPFLDGREPECYLFSPREAIAARRTEQRKNRKSRVQPSQASRKKARPRKRPGERYSTGTYGNAVEQACLKAGVPPFGVNRLRHSVGTDVRKIADLDTARALLGHASASMTETYAEVDAEKARDIMRRIG